MKLLISNKIIAFFKVHSSVVAIAKGITRRQILKMAGGFVAGSAVAEIVNLTANKAPKTETLSPAFGIKKNFVGPFPSWRNVKTDYHATGNGVKDDTNALQQALNALALDNHPKVLYLPAGTYRITQPLVMTSQINVSVVGKNPSSTTIKWDGPQGGTMLRLNGVRYSRLGRLTFDGNAGKALIAVDQSWDGNVPNFDTGNEYADISFQDVGYGIQAGGLGHGAAESAVLRCQFLRCSNAGIITKNFNALDWFVWYSIFNDCKVGVTNHPGSGNFHVFNSIFMGSTEADVEVGNAEFFSLRNNFSLNSKAFFIANFIGQNGSPTTIQGNTIIDPRDDSPIKMQNLGPVLLIDNAIRSRKGSNGPVVQYNTFAPVDLVSMGNKFTVSNMLKVEGRFIRVDDQTVSPDKINASMPKLPTSWLTASSQVFEVPVGSSAAAIQKVIASAAKQNGQQPIVHLPAGNYSIDRTLVIPAGSDIQLMGDGFNTSLNWVGSSSGPVLHLVGPSKATLYDFSINSAASSNGILVDNADQAGSRVFMEQVFLNNSSQYNLLVDGLDHTNIELHNFYHSDCTGTSVKVVGGASAALGKPLEGKTNIFSGASSNSNLSYTVSNGGRLMARDIWYETGSLPGFIQLTDKGTFTLHNGMFYTAAGKPTSAVEVNNFAGKASIIGGLINDRIVVNGDGSNTKVLALGMQGNSDKYLANNSPKAKAALLYGRKYNNGSYPVAHQGNPAVIVDGSSGTEAFLKDMLAQTRSEKPGAVNSLKNGITDVRFYRVKVQRSLIGVDLKGTVK